MKRRMEKLDEGEIQEKMFQDAVHGAITLHPLCVSVIDTPQFQRLRFLKMVGSCYFVFPAAAHNRFEHCLGVCHLAGLLVRALQSRQKDLNITETDILCVQLAGLCHDLGHGPFSHLWEQFVKRARPDKCWKHEDASVQMFDYLLKTNNLLGDFEKYGLKEKDIIFIKEMIHGPFKSDDEWPYTGRPREKAFLYQVVANKETGIDVDKWDYFLRDSHNLGIKVTFDYHRLIQFSRVIHVDSKGLQICIRDKECCNIYDMFHARRVLHRTAYTHRVVQTIDRMLIDAFLHADKHIQYRGSDGKKYFLGDVCDDMSAYTTMTDEVFQRVLLAEGNHPELECAKDILSNILTRQLYLCVGQTKSINTAITCEDLEKALERNLPEDVSLHLQDLAVTKAELNYGMKDQNPVEMAYFYNKKSPNEAKTIKKDDATMLPERFQETIFRVLCKSNNETKFTQAQEALRMACKELNMQDPCVDFWPSLFTPTKKKQMA